MATAERYSVFIYWLYFFVAGVACFACHAILEAIRGYKLTICTIISLLNAVALAGISRPALFIRVSVAMINRLKNGY